MQIAYKSDIGRIADHNEDALAILLDQDFCLVMVADGVGGHHAGEVASKIAVQSLQKFLLARGEEGPEEDWAETLRAAFDCAHQEITRQASQDDNLAGMATTLVLGLFQDGKLHLAHVGDSRAYRLQSRRLTPLTQDHSLVATMVKSGLITPQEAQHHALKNVITQCLGCQDYLGPDINTFDLASGDIFLFCSDGLTDMLGENKIRRVMRRHARKLPQGAEKLVAMANKNGGRDNITVVLTAYD